LIPFYTFKVVLWAKSKQTDGQMENQLITNAYLSGHTNGLVSLHREKVFQNNMVK